MLIAVNVTIEIAREGGDRVVRAEGHVRTTRHILSRISGTPLISAPPVFDLVRSRACIPLARFALNERTPGCSLVGHPGLDAFPEHSFRQRGRKTSHHDLEPINSDDVFVAFAHRSWHNTITTVTKEAEQ